MEDNLDFWKIEDDIKFWKMEYDLTFWKMEDELNILENGRQPQYFGKWKTA